MNTKHIIKWFVMSVICLGIFIEGCETDGSSPVSGQKPGETTKLQKKDYPIKPVSFTDVKFTDDFWSGRIETNRKVSIPYAFGKCEETGRIDNFAIAGGL